MLIDYSTIYGKWEATMLQDAHQAITSCELWDWLKEFKPEEGKGFMFSSHENLIRIGKAMKYEGHSGASYAWTMRIMQHIATNGWEEHSKLVKEKIKRKEIVERLRLLWLDGKMSTEDYEKIRDTA